MTDTSSSTPKRQITLKSRITLLTLSFVGAMLLLLVLVSSYAFNQFALLTAKEHARSAAEIVRVSMTEAMINGVIHKRQGFLQRIAEVDGLKQARVLRGQAVTRQFGQNNQAVADTIESQVMRTGLADFRLVDEQPLFRATIPYIASNQGQPNCLSCHQVSSDTVLGVVTIEISIEALQTQAWQVVALMAAALGAVALLFLGLFRRQLNPIIDIAQGVQAVVGQARLGEFSGRIDYQGDDEVAQIAKDLNRLMGYLEERLGETCRDVAKLMKYDLPQQVDLLHTTTDMVAGLVDVSQFKQEIEGDQTRQEIYGRIAHILRDQFSIPHFSLYEVRTDSNSMTPMLVDSQPDSPCRWCNKAILDKADSCRAVRSGHIIDAVAQPHLCSQFVDDPHSKHRHICLPVIQSGSVSTVVQLVCQETLTEQLYRDLPLILVYLRESASVIEAKRLLNTLHETTLRDAMTGLHNRRFLEEYLGMLVATVQRKEQRLSVLMMDLDKFKQVNDSYGHDAGDTVLKALAKTLQSQVRESDLVIRYGGEEFLIILQETGDGDFSGEVIAEKIRSAVEQLNIQIPGQLINKTLSIGVAHYPIDHQDFWEVVKCADTALYAAKHSGRNKVVRWQAGIETEFDSAPSTSTTTDSQP